MQSIWNQPKRLPDGRVAIYRAYDGNGELLYVGITEAPKRRITREHRKYSLWYREAHTFDVRVLLTREFALVAEAMAIIREQPRWDPDFSRRLIDDAFLEPVPVYAFTWHVERGRVFD